LLAVGFIDWLGLLAPQLASNIVKRLHPRNVTVKVFAPNDELHRHGSVGLATRDEAQDAAIEPVWLQDLRDIPLPGVVAHLILLVDTAKVIRLHVRFSLLW